MRAFIIPGGAVQSRARRQGVLICCCLLLAGCVSQFERSGRLDYPADLLTGERLFDEEVRAEEAPTMELLALSPAMEAYVAQAVSDSRLSALRFRQLFAALARDGYFKALYAPHRTLTAAEAFEAKAGNCLSYTNMFIALARAAGLDAVYQVVDVPPSWDADAGFIIRYSHINVLVRDAQLVRATSEAVTVDFNAVHPTAEDPTAVVSDSYAESLYYANRSFALLREGRTRQSFAHLRRALETEPRNIDLWINLGAFYAHQGDHAGALAAYEVALQLDRRHKSAYSGLARTYAALGRVEEAALYEEKVRNYRRRNPYYHYALAQMAFEESDYERSLGAINTALNLKRRSPRFHHFKGLIQQKLGLQADAEASFRRAQRYGLRRDVDPRTLRSSAMVTSG